MTTVQTNNANSEKATIDMKLEVVVLPVADVDRAKHFYTSLGWRLDADFATSEDFRVVQVTPPGSEASVIFGKGITAGTPGSRPAAASRNAAVSSCTWSRPMEEPPRVSTTRTRSRERLLTDFVLSFSR